MTGNAALRPVGKQILHSHTLVADQFELDTACRQNRPVFIVFSLTGIETYFYFYLFHVFSKSDVISAELGQNKC